ncbi:response regulator [Prosthecobacter vanneervenii]|uniref:CheY-like chemotaxis protein n=1 Tax=Prosthecobacter vanneervenii TaxID=48466 RepID=A0A7W7YE35_9BACT|nr:response regulator [Prosthecobacter vanneervenii]MBB5034486.1 CheY-like chemotaxis protein [Prosthecobacter vanneervenii]
MKILIVEDDQNKLAQLRSFILQHTPSIFIESCCSYRSALARLLEEEPFDLILLDMSMPTFDKSPSESGGRNRPFGGKDILRKLKHKGVKTPVVVVTQFTHFGEGKSCISLDVLKQQLAEEGFENYQTTIFYNAQGTTWEVELKHWLSHGGLK